MGRRGFHSAKPGVQLRLAEFEFEVLADLLEHLEALVAPQDSAPTDPLAAMVGIAETAEKPADPALARLLPDAYRDDPAAAADFRRYTEQGLRHQKVEDCRTAVGSLERVERGKLPLTEAEAGAWLRSLNDLRLVLGVRLGIDSDDVVPDDELYDWLTWLQATLVDALLADGGVR